MRTDPSIMVSLLFSQRDLKWRDVKLGSSNTTIGSHGCTVTSLAMLLAHFGQSYDPHSLNILLTAKGGFAAPKENPKQKNLIIWKRVAELLPVIFIGRFYSYSNTEVAKHLKDCPVLVEVDGAPIGGSKHWVLYVGDKKLVDPWDGKVKPTSAYTPTGYSVYKPKEVIKPMPEKTYTQAEWQTERDERNKNWTLYQDQLTETQKFREQYENLKKESDGFLETLAGKLTTIADRNEVLGALGRLIEVEDQLNAANKKLMQLEKKHSLERDDWKMEMNNLRAAVQKQQAENERLLLRIDVLEAQIAQDKPSQELVSTVKKLFTKLLERIKKGKK